MSTTALCNQAGIDPEANDAFERMPRRDGRPMPVHRSGAACRAASRANGRQSNRPKRSRRSSAAQRRLKRVAA